MGHYTMHWTEMELSKIVEDAIYISITCTIKLKPIIKYMFNNLLLGPTELITLIQQQKMTLYIWLKFIIFIKTESYETQLQSNLLIPYHHKKKFDRTYETQFLIWFSTVTFSNICY